MAALEFAECECCGEYHPVKPLPVLLPKMAHRLAGPDCRDDSNRFTWYQLDAQFPGWVDVTEAQQ